MKVLHLISSGGMYGAEAVILSLLKAFEDTSTVGCELAIFQHSPHIVPELYTAALCSGVDPALVHLLPCHGQIDLGFGARLRAIVAKSRIDLLHAHGYKADIYARFASKQSGPARVSTCHTWYDNDWAVRLYGALDRRILRQYQAVVAVSAEVGDRLLKAGVRPSRIHLIRNGVAMERFRGIALTRANRALPSTGAQLRVGLVGRLAPEKGVDIFLQAIALLRERYPAVVYEVAGEGPERGALEQLLQDLKLNGTVTLGGSRTDMAEFYAGLDVLVSASRQEGLPVALLEGMASGLPVVATAVGAVPEVIVEGVTGLLAAPESPGSLAAAIEVLLNNKARRSELGRAAQQRVAEHFSATRMAEDYLAVYQQALAPGDGPEQPARSRRGSGE